MNFLSKNRLPRLEGRSLDNIKLFAAIFMVIDHIHLQILDRQSEIWMFFAGRGAFPLFCYILATAVVRGKKDDAFPHATKLLLLAFLVEPVSQLTRDIGCLNVVFTLAVGCAFARIAEKLKDWQIGLGLLTAAALALGPEMMEFGLAGALLPAAMVLVMKGRKNAWPVLIFLLLTVNVHNLTTALQERPAADVLLVSVMTGLFAAVIFFFALVLSADTGENGKRYLPKYALHIFYPAHLLLLFFAHLLMK